MTQQNPNPLPRPSKPRPGTMKAGSPTPQIAIMELKQRILVALGKLADRDTQQIAVEELDRIVDTLSPDCVYVCLSCLYDSEMQQKSMVKKECVRLFGSLACIHGDLIIPHLPKIIGSIMRRLRDPDSSVRDACVDAMGILSSRMISSSSSASTHENGLQATSSSTSSPSLTLTTFSKPLFDALSEQNKSVQTGAAMCLARVLERARDPPLSAMSRLCPRICKFMSSPNFVARPALLAVFGSLSQVGALGQAQLTMVMPCVHEALENADWATRKAAAETLSCLCTNPGYALASFKSPTLHILESCRFDKVKPVRDSVLDAMQLWKALPGTNSESLGSSSKSDNLESVLTPEKQLLQSPSPTASERSLGTRESPANEKTRDAATEERRLSRVPKVSPEKSSDTPKKRNLPFADKKMNPGFFEKLSARHATDWEIEVAMPHKPLRYGAPKADGDDGIASNSGALRAYGKSGPPSEKPAFRGEERYNNDGSFVLDDGDDDYDDDDDDEGEILPMNQRSGVRVSQIMKPTLRQGKKEINLDKHLVNKDLDNRAWEACGQIRVSSATVEPWKHELSNDTVNLQSFQNHLFQLEQQQADVLQMVQEFIISSQESTLALQDRVIQLEKMVEEMTFDSDVPSWQRTNEDNGGRVVGKHDYTSQRNGRGGQVDREPASAERLTAGTDVEEEDHTYQIYQNRLAGTLLVDSQLVTKGRSNGGATELLRTGSDDLGLDQVVTRRVWNKGPQIGLGRRGEGPSARSVWQACKDEATLAAIRVAGEDAETLSVGGGSSKIALGKPLCRANGQDKSQWTLWSSVLELVRGGDVELAYSEVLCAGDELVLVRLMSRTGPVLDQLTTSTASDLLRLVGQFLQQQNYIHLCVAWIQQVVDMADNDGADCLELSEDAKKELLLSIQESLSTSVSEGCSGSTGLEQILQILMDAWSMSMEDLAADV